MNKQKQLEHFEVFVEEMRNTLFSKGDDYANEDRLSNFKLAGSIIGLRPEINCLNLIATKVARLGVLLNSNKDPKNESISDTLKDLANYCILLDAILKEDEVEQEDPYDFSKDFGVFVERYITEEAYEWIFENVEKLVGVKLSKFKDQIYNKRIRIEK